MTTKKKKNTLDAIDKYLQQKRYSQGKKYEKKEKPTKKIVSASIPKFSSSLYSAPLRNNDGNRKSARTAKVPDQKNISNKLGKGNADGQCTDISKRSIQIDTRKLPKRVVRKTSRTKQKTAKSQVSPPNRAKSKNRENLRTNPEQLNPDTDTNDEVQLSKKSASKGRTIRKNAKNSLKSVEATKRNPLSNKTDTRENPRANKSSGKSRKKSNKKVIRASRTAVKRKSKSNENFEDNPADENFETNSLVFDSKSIQNAHIVPKNSCETEDEGHVTDTLGSIREATVVANNNTGTGKKISENANSRLPKKKRKIIDDDENELVKTNLSDLTLEPCCSQNNVPLSSQGQNVDIEQTEEITPITKKYQPYMERLKLLSSDDIKKYIQDNQEHCVNYKNEIESKTKKAPLPKKKRKKYDEMRESFKCNPFNSDQQLAMYCTLREIFEVPKTHFVECRNLFTALLPEISCRLFADTFRIDAKFAPRLIKKLYPNPVCPV